MIFKTKEIGLKKALSNIELNNTVNYELPIIDITGDYAALAAFTNAINRAEQKEVINDFPRSRWVVYNQEDGYFAQDNLLIIDNKEGLFQTSWLGDYALAFKTSKGNSIYTSDRDCVVLNDSLDECVYLCFGKNFHNEIWEIFTERFNEEIFVCSERGAFMQKGYCIRNGEEYYCSDECLHEHYTEQEWSEMYEDGGENYWTEW